MRANEATKPEHSPKGWQATLQLGFEQRGDKTQLTHRKRQGPLAVQRTFHPEADTCHAYLLHPPGGIAGGDGLNIQVQVDSGSALITTPGAGKFYRSIGPTSVVEQTLSVTDQTSLEWLPQETILFPGAQVSSVTRIDLHGSAAIVAWEIICLGRPTNAERFDQGRADFRFELWRDRSPILLERLRVENNTTATSTYQRASVLGKAPVTGTAVFSHADPSCLENTRSLIQDHSEFSATLIEDLLILRYLGHSTEHANTGFRAAWQALRPSTINRPACPPRIWST